MKHQHFLAAFLALFMSGCGGLMAPQPLDVAHDLLATIEPQTRGFVIKSLSPTVGDISLRTLQPTSSQVIEKWCQTSENTACMNDILEQIDHNHHRAGILAHYNTLLASHDTHVAKMQALKNAVAPSYERDRKKLSLEVRINDLTKLYEGETIDTQKLVWIGLHDLSMPYDHTGNILATFPLDLQRYEQTMTLLGSSLELTYLQEQTTYFHTLAHVVTSYPIKRAPNLTQGNYRFAIRADTTIARTQTSPKRVIVDIIGKTYRHVVPPHLRAEDAHILVETKEDRMIISNKTNQPLTLNTLALHFQEETYAHPIDVGFATLAPRGSVVIPSVLFGSSAFDQVATFEDVTSAIARRMMITYGLTLSYTQEGKIRHFKPTFKQSLHHILTGN